MKNQKSIQILRGTREKILKNKDEKLLKGQPLYNLTDNTLSIGDENSNIDKLPIATNELHGNMDGIKSTNAQGVYDYSISYVDNKGISIKNNVKYDGESIIFSDGSIGTQKGDIIPGAEATGIQSMAFGGLRYDYFNPEENNWGKTPTSAEGNQSFAAGASVHAHGDFSVAFGKDNDAHQRGGFVTGGGCRVGMTEEEFNAFYWDDVNNIPLNDGKGKNADGKITDFENKPYEQSYSFGFTSGASNIVEGNYSSAFGRGLRTSPKNNNGQHIIGRWNDLNYLELMAFAVGAGSDDNNRKNLLSLYNDGRLRLPNITETLTDNDVPTLKYVKEEINSGIDKKFEALDSDFFNSIY